MGESGAEGLLGTGSIKRLLGGAGHVTGLRALRPINDLEFDRLALFEGSKSRALNRGVVHEDIAAAFALDETVALRVIEPLDLACDAHTVLFLSCWWSNHRT